MRPLREIRMLAGLYSFSGLYCLLFVGWMLWWMVASRGGWIFLIMQFTLLLGVCLAFFFVTYGVLKGRGWARTLGLILSGGAIAFMLFEAPIAVPGILAYWLSGHELLFPNALALFSPLLLVTNGLCVYYLTRSRVRAMFARLE
jgi:hypothetical protein